MATVNPLIVDFLAQKRIAVLGVSRKSAGDAGNAVYDKLKSAGYEVYAVNPKTDHIGSDPCYPDLESLPGPVDGVVCVTPPEVTEKIVAHCRDLGIERIWMHRSFGNGSVSEQAVEFAEERGLSVIAGACPLMYCEPVDPAHRCMRWILKVTGRLPR